MMVVIPDRVSTLELSKLWIHKALQEFEAESTLEVDAQQEQPAENEDQTQSDSVE